MEWLDGLRAYAICLVIIVHSSLSVTGLSDSTRFVASFGMFGVQLFFVISAITVYMTLRSTDSVKGWWIRRFFRIAPLYYAAIALYGVWQYTLLAGDAPAPLLWLAASGANAVFLHGWVPKAANSIVPGGWSIAAEMMFYLVAPRLVKGLLTGGLGWRGLSIMAAACLTVTWFFAGAVEANSYFYYWPPTQFPVFLMALYLVHRNYGWLLNGQKPPANSGPLMIASAGFMAGILACYFDLYIVAPLLIGLGFVGITMLARSGIGGAFSNRIAVEIGRVSFSIYITHFAVLRILRDFTPYYEHFPGLAGWVGAAAITLSGAYIISKITFYAIEKPGNRIGRSVSQKVGSHPDFLESAIWRVR